MQPSDGTNPDLTQKINRYTQAINQNPHDKQAYFGRATAYLAAQDYSAAVADINALISLDANHVDALAMRATLNGLLTASDKTQGSEDRTGQAETLFQRGQLALQNKAFEQARADLQQAIQLMPFSAQAHYSYGLALEQTGDLEAAQAAYNRAIAINNRIPNAFYRHGLVMFKLHDFAGAIPYLSRAHELKMDFWQAMVLEGLCYARQLDFDAALRLYNHVLEQKADDATAYAYRAFVKLRTGDSQAALSDATEAINLKPKEAGYWANRGTIHLELGQHNEALNDYLHALNLKSEDHSALAGLAVTQRALGNTVGANHYWQDLLKLDARYGNMDWLQKELNWADALVEEARKLSSE